MIRSSWTWNMFFKLCIDTKIFSLLFFLFLLYFIPKSFHLHPFLLDKKQQNDFKKRCGDVLKKIKITKKDNEEKLIYFFRKSRSIRYFYYHRSHLCQSCNWTFVNNQITNKNGCFCTDYRHLYLGRSFFRHWYLFH